MSLTLYVRSISDRLSPAGYPDRRPTGHRLQEVQVPDPRAAAGAGCFPAVPGFRGRPPLPQHGQQAHADPAQEARTER